MNKKKNKFIAIAHSTYTMQNASGLVEDMLKTCQEKGITTLAITDHGNINHFGDLYLQSKKYNVKPIFGCEFACVDDLQEMWRLKDELEEDSELSTQERNKKKKELRASYNITLLAKNAKGLENLFTLVYMSYKDGFYFKPRIDMKLLKKYSDGIICVSNGIFDCIQQHIINGNSELATKQAQKYQKMFGNDFYLSLQFNELQEQSVVNKGLLKISEELNIPTILSNTSYFLNEDGFQARKSLLLLQFKKTYEDLEYDKNFFKYASPEFYIKNAKDIKKAYDKFGKKDVSSEVFLKSLKNLFKLNDSVEDIEYDTTPKLFKTHENPDSELVKLCALGLKKRGLSKKKEYVERLKFELDVIQKKGFSGYFLICHEIVKNAKKNMLVGSGRGSGAGALINYLLEITDLDPIRFGLFFERFLNVDRDDMPDIDIDFQQPDLVKEWIKERFGVNNVASISTFGTFKMKNLIKDLGRVYNIPLQEINVLNKIIDKNIDMIYPGENKSIVQLEYKDYYEKCPEFKQFMDNYPQLSKDYQVLHNQIRQVGKHAAGVIIYNDLYKKMPTMIQKSELQTGITEGLVNKNLSDLGFIKFDILGLSTLKIIDDTAQMIAQKKGINKNLILEDLRPDKLDLNILEVYQDIFLKGRTAGIFQFGSDGMKKLLKKSQVDCFNDLTAITSLYRPGPLASGMADQYGENKKKPDDIQYVHPITKKILSSTYNLLIYQEQMMSLAHELGGLTLAETNTLRKVIIKQSTSKNDKKAKQRQELYEKFIQGATEINKLTKEQAELIWSNMEAFAGYAFNLSHAASYSVISYQTAYLKKYYPLEFYTALFNYAIDKEDQLKIYLEEAIKFGIKILPPNINKSKKYFTVEGDAIRFSLLSIKGIGEKACDSIEEVNSQQTFTHLQDFFESKDIKWRSVNKKVVNNLILFGYFDIFDKNRKRILQSYESFKEKGNKILKVNNSKFLACYKKLDDVENYTELEMTQIEKDMLGFNFFYNPFKVNKRDKKNKIMKRMNINGDIKTANTNKRLLGLIVDKMEHMDKNNNLMAFLRVQDEFGQEVDVTVFGNDYKYLIEKTQLNEVYLFKVKPNMWQERKTFILNTGYDADQSEIKNAILHIDEPKIVKWLKEGAYEKFNQ